jgi:hypothetical protein
MFLLLRWIKLSGHVEVEFAYNATRALGIANTPIEAFFLFFSN